MEISGSSYRVGEWLIDPKRGAACRGDENVHLEPKATELLNLLASRAGEVVSRTELLDVVWRGVVVNDDVINNTVAKLRHSLQDNPKLPELIETIPKRGYRLIAPVSDAGPKKSYSVLLVTTALFLAAVITIALVLQSVRVKENELHSAQIENEVLPLPDKPSVAVLPFVNLSDDSNQEYFVDGVTEDLIIDLSRVSGLFVIARNSSFVYKNKSIDIKTVGNELGVQYVIEGSVRKLADKLRINVQLINVETGGHLWAEHFDGNIDDVFAFQNKIAEEIVNALSVTMTGTQKNYASFQETYSPEAYEAFLKGWAAYKKETPEDYAKAITNFEIAVNADPSYGRALAAMAAVYWETYRKRWHRRLGISPLSNAWQRANENLEKSMIAPTPIAHKVASAMLMTNRRYDEAFAEAKRAIAIDPNDPLGYIALAEVFMFTGLPAKAEELIYKAMRLDPQHRVPYLQTLGLAQLEKGDVANAVHTLEQATQGSPDNRLSWMALISAYGLNNQPDKANTALTVLAKLQHNDKLVSFTVAHAREHWPFKNESDRENFLDGLRRAGVAEW